MKINNKKTFTFILFSFIFLGTFIFFERVLTTEKELSVKLISLKKYGKVSGSKNELFGIISSFTVDKNQNLYVADDAFKIIKKISKEGYFIKEYGFGAGKGPGEFSAIHNIVVDSLDNIYVLDKVNLNINVFDSLNSLITNFSLPFMPAQIIVHNPLVVDVVGFPFTYEGDLIHRYDLSNIGSNDPQLTYGTRYEGVGSKESSMSGNSGRLLQSKSKDVYYAYFYPYLIQKYSENGEHINSFEGYRKLEIPHRNPLTGVVESNSGIKEFIVLPEEILMLLVNQKFDNEYIQFFDFIDGKTGEFLGSINCEKLGLGKIRYIRSDLDGNIYLDFSNPFPHIQKYKLILEVK